MTCPPAMHVCTACTSYACIQCYTVGACYYEFVIPVCACTSVLHVTVYTALVLYIAYRLPYPERYVLITLRVCNEYTPFQEIQQHGECYQKITPNNVTYTVVIP